MSDEKELPLLGGISFLLYWLEQLVVQLSGPLLVLGTGIGLVSLFTDGALLLNTPTLLYVWAISQAVGVDGQLVGAWFRVARAVARRQYVQAVLFAVLGLILAYIAYISAYVFTNQQTYQLTVATSLQQLGMDSHTWLWQRVGVSVFLVCLSGLLRYRPPVAVASIESEKLRLQNELELAPLRAQVALQKAHGMRSTIDAVLKRTAGDTQADQMFRQRLNTLDASLGRIAGDTPAAITAGYNEPVTSESQAVGDTASTQDAGVSPDEPDDTSTGSKKPSARGGKSASQVRAGKGRGLRLVGASNRATPRVGNGQRHGTKLSYNEIQRVKAFAVLDADNKITRDALMQTVGCGAKAASELRTAWRNERKEQASAQALM